MTQCNENDPVLLVGELVVKGLSQGDTAALVSRSEGDSSCSLCCSPLSQRQVLWVGLALPTIRTFSSKYSAPESLPRLQYSPSLYWG